MRIQKHNPKLCSVILPDKKLPGSKSNISQLKKRIFSWPLLFLGTFITLFALGLSPLQFLTRFIQANFSKTETISLYAHNVTQENAASSYEEGWWNHELASLSPQLGVGSEISEFDDKNSSFYTGGNFSLSLSSFRFLEDSIGDFGAETNLETEDAPIDQTSTETNSEENISTDDINTEEESSSPAVESMDLDVEEGDIEIINEESLIQSEGEADSIIKASEDLSIADYASSIFTTSPVLALEMLSTKIENLSDLGVFKSANLKLSMAFSEVGGAKDLGAETSLPIESESLEGLILNEEVINEEAATINSEEANFETGAEIFEIELENLETGPTNTDAGIIETAPLFETVDVMDEYSEESGEIEVLEEENILFPEPEPEPETETSNDVPEILSLFDFVNRANAQEAEADAKIVIWYTFASSTDELLDSELVWHELDSLGGETANNALNGGYFSYDASFLSDWSDIDNLKIKVEAKEAKNSYIAYLDSVWLEAEYQPSEEVMKINKRKEWEKALKLISSQIDFRMDEQGIMRFHYQKNRQDLLETVGNFFGLASYWEDVSIRAALVDYAGQEVDLPLAMIFEEEGDFGISLPHLPRGFKPGKYAIRFYIEDSSGGTSETISIDQDFSWGVLALNTNKSIYTVEDDSAFLQMAVLDERGKTLCFADLGLSITTPNGDVVMLNTDNAQIVRNEDCGPDNVIDTPDYYANFMLDFVGEYKLSLTATTTNGVYTISDSFSVVENVAFDVERVAPTRIFPLANYDMKINIKANQDFEGDIADFVPSGFEIASQTATILRVDDTYPSAYSNIKASGTKEFEFAEKVNEQEKEKELSWKNISLSAGDILILNYEFDAPDVAPEFYLLGSLEMADFSESRQWQIASDAIAIGTSTNGTNVSWINATNAWDNGINTYANRTIPRKTGGGEPANYIQSTSNSHLNLGGDINTVEIGIEGYVANTAVTAYLIPYFNGSSAGTQYSITGATLGTSDDDITDYVNITNSSGAPATWTWADIQNLDVRIYGGNTSNSADYPFYIDQIRIRVDYTANTAPDGTFVTASQRKENSGIVDISIQVSDANGDDSRARIDYVSGADCNFSSPLDPTLDEIDINTTSTSSVDPKVLNSNIYQIGTSTGWINTSEGANTVSFDWLSASNTLDMEGVYCLKVTANDMDNDDASPATTTLSIDNKAPSQPGVISDASSTKDSITLYYGSASSDLNFLEYRIYYDTTSVVDESDSLHSTTTDADLDDVSFGGTASTTITGLLENQTYYFAVWAYDEYGHKSSSSVFSFATNKTPDAIFNIANPATQRTDGSGIVDVAIDVNDFNNDQSMAKLEYVEGVSCDFSSPLKPLLDESAGNISSTYGLTSIENDNDYQIGNSAGWIQTPATNTVSFDWLAQNDITEADGTYCLRLTANDRKDNQNIPVTTTLVLDNVAPTNPGNLIFDSISTSTLTLGFGATTTETNFAYYKMYYKIGTSGVTESDTPHNDDNLNDILFNSVASTTISGLIPDTNYVVNIWAYDDYGNISSATEVSFRTDATVSNISLTLTNPVSANWLIADGYSVYNFQAVVSEDNGWNNLNNVILRLADASDNTSPFTDIEFTWNQTNNTFTETGVDADSIVSISPSSNSSCGGFTCTINFNLIFDSDFSISSTNYSGELYSTNDGSVNDSDTYTDIYQAKIIYVEQVHYRWRNDDGGE